MLIDRSEIRLYYIIMIIDRSGTADFVREIIYTRTFLKCPWRLIRSDEPSEYQDDNDHRSITVVIIIAYYYYNRR